MKPNKKLFFDVLERVAALSVPEGFVPLPAYVSGWEPENQAYQATLIRSDISEYIDQLNVAFHPAWKAFRFTVNRSRNSYGFNDLSDLPDEAGEWTGLWLYQPYDEYALLSGSSWNIFSTHLDFRVGKGKSFSAEIAAAKVCTEFERNSAFLHEALRGKYSGRLVQVSHYEIQRPK